MADNVILKFQGGLLEGTELEEIVHDDGVYLAALEAPGLGLHLAVDLAAGTKIDEG